MVLSYTLDDIRALVEAGIALTSELSLDVILQKLVDVARRQVNARYAAISVLDDQGCMREFVTSGITEEERAQIGNIPVGRGLLAVLLHEGMSLRLADMASDPRSVGFPPNHPPMKSLLGVPVVSRGRIIGNLYLTDKEGQGAFDDRDEEIVRLLSTQAAAAIETSRLQESLESLARLEERERIAMDLHDGVIQTVYAVALHLEDAANRVVGDAPKEVQPTLNDAIDNLHQVIKDIRSYIFDLRAQVSEVGDLPGAIRELAETVRVNTLMNVGVQIAALQESLEREQALGLFHIAQEALNNVSKHSKATAVSVRLSSSGGRVHLEIEDNGEGFQMPGSASGGKHGLRNMKDRARSMGADLFIDSEIRRGTIVRVAVPLVQAKDGADG